MKEFLVHELLEILITAHRTADKDMETKLAWSNMLEEARDLLPMDIESRAEVLKLMIFAEFKQNPRANQGPPRPRPRSPPRARRRSRSRSRDRDRARDRDRVAPSPPAPELSAVQREVRAALAESAGSSRGNRYWCTECNSPTHSTERCYKLFPSMRPKP